MLEIPQSRSRQQHVEIAEFLQGLIQSGELAPGDQLPSEAELCAQFGSSRGPVRQAVATLRSEGLVSSGRGRRSTVLDTQTSNSFEALLSATTFIEEKGHTAGKQILHVGQGAASDTVADAFGIEHGEQVVEIRSIRTADDVPVMLETLFFPIRIGVNLLNLTSESKPVHQQLLDMGVEVDNVVRKAHISQADTDKAGLLHISEGAPLFNIQLRASTYQGETVEYAEYSVRGDVITLSQSHVRGGSVPVKLSLNSAHIKHS